MDARDSAASAAVHPANGFSEAARQAVYDAIALRRDIRNFRPDPVPEEVLLRVLGAAHRAGSVGFMQPWDFVLIRSVEQKERLYQLFRAANGRAAARFQDDRRAKYGALKLQGVLDAPLCICVTCDTRRGGPHVLGRDSIRETDVYSTCLAIQNLWLAARAEGVGVGWVSIVDNQELAACLGLPGGVVPVALLCVGYPVEFPEVPLLEATGWRARQELARLVHFEQWGGEATADWAELRGALGGSAASLADAPAPLAPPGPTPSLAELVRDVAPLDLGGPLAAAVRARLDELSKPRGSMGALEELAVRLAVIQGRRHPVADRARIAVFAGDHGVCAEGVSAYRAEVTARLCYNMVAGGAVVSALARQVGAEVVVVDVGVDHDFEQATGILHHKVARGTRNLAVEPALTRAQAERAVLAGAEAVLRAGSCDVLALGEVGIGNTTSASALVALLTGTEASAVVGRGTGVGDTARRSKLRAVDRMLQRCRARDMDVVDRLAEAGGLEIAALVGAILAAAARRVPVLLDGFITGAAALVAAELNPAVRDYLVAAHRSAEQGHALVLQRLELSPLLELDLRLGEGSGAALALPLIRAACGLLTEVRTFREAGIEEPLDPRGMA